MEDLASWLCQAQGRLQGPLSPDRKLASTPGPALPRIHRGARERLSLGPSHR